MGKAVILAVAGSGKSTFLINKVDEGARTLMLTYTNNNLHNLKRKLVRRFGLVPPGLRLLSYFSFLYLFCYKPLLWRKLRTRGISWSIPPEWTRWKGSKKRSFYMDHAGRLYHNRIARILREADVLSLVTSRLEKYFDCLLIDEVQDFGGHDFNFLQAIVAVDREVQLVGDFYQHTFDTSRDGRVNANLYSDYGRYRQRLEKMGLEVDETTLRLSHRCSRTICDFVSRELGIEVGSHRAEETTVEVVRDFERARKLLCCNATVKLFYQQHELYNCYSRNWGDTKGEDDYEDVCVVLNGTSWEAMCKRQLHKLAPQTRSKLYVACTRARKNLYFLPPDSVKAT